MGQKPTAAEIIARLELKPHPEGGHYRETFRDPRVDESGRARSTAIYFLLVQRALALAPHRCRGGLAPLRRQRAAAADCGS
jgi:predicted cupin superfamily sugar epimerase